MTSTHDKSASNLQLPHWTDPVSEGDLVDRRREIHRVPETGWNEFVSTARAATILGALGFTVRVGREFLSIDHVRGRNKHEVLEAEKNAHQCGVTATMLARMGGLTGCIATFDTGRPGKHIAIRVELDAIRMTEPTSPEHLPCREGFASIEPGVMHACGHDGHQAVVLELGRFVLANRERLSGRITFLFEPGEEGSRGAYPIVQSGVLDDVDILFCAHISPELPGGVVVPAPEKFLCTTKIDFHFDGKPSHAGLQPQLGHNALLAAANASMMLMALPRHSEGMTRVNVGTLTAGEGRNVVAAHADMEVEVRGENESINRELTEAAVLRAEGAAMAFGCRCSHAILGEAIDFVPDEGIVQMITVCARHACYAEDIVPSVPMNSSDDATLLIRRVQSRGGKAGYFLVGAALPPSEGRDADRAAVDWQEKYLVTMYGIYVNLLVGLSGNW